MVKKEKEKSINANDVAVNYLMNFTEQNIKTGIINIDSGIGILKQSFTLIAGVSGSGKTAYALNIANYNVKQGKKVLFVNLKDSVENLSIRVLSMNSKIPVEKLFSGLMTEQEWDACTESIAAHKDAFLLLYNICDNHWGLNKIISTIIESNADLIIIDDMQMIEIDDEETEKNKYTRDRMDYILRKIQALSVQCRMPIIGTYCMSSRKINSRPDHRPMITDFDYDSLQQYPDNIQLLYRNDLYSWDSVELKDIVEIITVKSLFNKCYTTQVMYVNGVYTKETEKIVK